MTFSQKEKYQYKASRGSSHQSLVNHLCHYVVLISVSSFLMEKGRGELSCQTLSGLEWLCGWFYKLVFQITVLMEKILTQDSWNQYTINPSYNNDCSNQYLKVGWRSQSFYHWRNIY